MTTHHTPNWVQSAALIEWVTQFAHITKPDAIHWCDGSEQEQKKLTQQLVDQGTLLPIPSHKKRNCYVAMSDPSDVARVEASTYVCTEKQEQAGPTNNWEDPLTMHTRLLQLFTDCMRGRTLYVIIYSMGPIGSPYAKIGVELSDSAYVAVSMAIMTRVGRSVHQALQAQPTPTWVRCIHSVGVPLQPGQPDTTWPCNKQHKYIVHFPQNNEIWSFGSGYGGNALLGKKCFALRLASVMGYQHGWLAEHMLIVAITTPEGHKHYVAAAFPSACGKTNFSMMIPPKSMANWRITTLGDDIAWIHLGADGRLYAINPENGFFGVVPGTNERSNPHALSTMQHNTIFTNVARTDDQDVWWEGLSEPPEHAIDWKNQDWTPRTGTPAAHPNARFTTPLRQCPSLDEEWESPHGVPLSAFVFGGRRSRVIPLAVESSDWTTGVYLAATLSSETTAANTGQTGLVRQDPFAMLPFCGYNMGDYFQHWLNMGQRITTHGGRLPKIFYVNWFRKDKEGQFIWPGFRDNARLLQWMIRRVEGLQGGHETPLGVVPAYEDIDWTELPFSREHFQDITQVQAQAWLKEVDGHRTFFEKFGPHLPKEIDLLCTELAHNFSTLSAQSATSNPVTTDPLLSAKA